MLVLIIGLILFLGIHSVRMVAPEWREARIASMGEGSWKGVYSLVSLVGLGLVIWGYSLAWPVAPDIYQPPAIFLTINAILMIPAMILIISSDLKAAWIKATVKHPMLLAVKLWAFGHLLANGDLASILMFGSFLAFAVTNRIAVSKRPGEALAATKPSWSMRDTLAIVLGLVIYFLFVWKLHVWLFGAVPYPV